MKKKKCIRCGLSLHYKDWEILKYHNTLPICDKCEMNTILKELNKEEIPKNNRPN